MTPLPSLPTDSLYKFITIGGLAMIVSGSLMFFQSKDISYKLEPDVVLHYTIDESMNEEKDLFIKQLEFLSSQSKDARIQDTLEEIKNNHERITEESEAKKTILSRVGAHNNRLKGELYSRTSFLLIYFGIFVFLAGCALWYIKVQKYIDKRLEYESRNHN